MTQTINININNSYNESYSGISTYNYGIVAKSYIEMQAYTQDLISSALGADANFDPSSPLGYLTQNWVNTFLDNQNQIFTTYNNINPYVASGFFLDSICSFNQIFRQSATSSYATCVCTGLSGVVIPAGSQVINGNGDIFYNKIMGIIGSNGTVLIDFYSEDLGKIQINGIKTIYSNINGWDTVDNTYTPEPDHVIIGKVGSDEETDYSLRIRRNNSVSISGSATLPAITSNIINIENVKDLVVFQNINTEPEQQQGITINGKSLYLIVFATTEDDSTKNDIANVLYTTKSAGCGLQNSGTSGISQDILIYPKYSPEPFHAKFDLAQKIGYKIKITLSKKYQDQGGYLGEQQELELIQNAINENMILGDNIKIGQTIFATTFTEILGQYNVKQIVKAEITYKSAISYTSFLNFTYTQIGNIENLNDIIVEYANPV